MGENTVIGRFCLGLPEETAWGCPRKPPGVAQGNRWGLPKETAWGCPRKPLVRQVGTPANMVPVTDHSPHPDRPSLWAIGRDMFILGLVSFGGNNALLVSRLVVDKRGWLTQAELDQGVALATMSPGGNSSNLSFEVGRRLRGLPGALVAYLAMALPGIIFVLTLGSLLLRNGETDLVNGLLRGAQAGVVAMVVMIGVRLAKSSLRGFAPWMLAVVAFAPVALLDVPIYLVVPPLALVGYMLARRGNRPAVAAPASASGDADSER